MRCVLSVLGKDITGIVARVATSLANDGVNIVDIRQSLLEDKKRLRKDFPARNYGKR